MFDQRNMSQNNGQSATVGMGSWFLLDCIRLIPVVGMLVALAIAYATESPTLAAVIGGIFSLVPLILYLVIACSRKSAPSLRSRVQLSLIYVVVEIVAAVLFAVLVIVPNLGTIQSAVQQLQQAQEYASEYGSLLSGSGSGSLSDYSSLYGDIAEDGDLSSEELQQLYSEYLDSDASGDYSYEDLESYADEYGYADSGAGSGTVSTTTTID